MRLYLLATLCCLVIFSTPLHAKKDFFKFTNIGVDEGLTNPFVIKVLQDRQGFLWVATQNGLYRYDGYEFKVFMHNPEDKSSIGGNYIQNLYEDSKGRLWISVLRAGLALYHAETESFTLYSPNNSNLSSEMVAAVAEDDDGSLWVATFGGGLNHFNPETKDFSQYRHNPNDSNSLSDDKVYSILVDSEGVLWAGTRNGGLNRFDENSQTFKAFKHQSETPASLSQNNVFSLLEDSKGQLWVGTRSGGLNRFVPETQSFIHYTNQADNPSSLPSNQVFSIFEDKVGDLWVGTNEGGLSLFQPQSESFVHYRNDPANKNSLFDNDIFAITQDNTGLIWLGTFGGGLSHFSPDSRRFGLVQYEPELENGLSEGDIQTLFKDSRGNLWIGSTAGLTRYDQDSNSYFLYQHDEKNPSSLSDNDVWAIYEDSQGQIWVGTTEGGLNVFSPNSEHSEDYQNLSFKRYQFDARNPHSLSDNAVRVITEDSNQQLWIGTKQGLNRYRSETDDFIRYSHDKNNQNSLSDNTIYSLLSGKSGHLWVGTRSGGLNLFDPQNDTFVRYSKDESNPQSLSDNMIYAIAMDSKEHLWLGTRGGLNRFNPETSEATHYRTKDGLFSDRVAAVQIDGNDNIWLGGDYISFIEGSSLEKGGKLSLIKDISTKADCGANQGSSFQDDSGKLYWGGVNQYCAFYPKDVMLDSTAPRIVFTDFKLANQSVEIPVKVGNSALSNSAVKSAPLSKVINNTSDIVLGYRDNILSFEFSALHFSDPKKNQYRYRLEGFRDEWITTDWTNRRATYTNLPADDYIFTVIAANDVGKWSQKGRSIKLTILPPPWKTWWAYTIYLFIISVIIWYFIYSQRKQVLIERAVNVQLKKLDKLKDELLANTSHELRTPLNAIVGLSESMICGATGELPEDATDCLHLVLKSGKRLTNLVNDIMDFSQLNSNELSIEIKPVNLRNIVAEAIQASQELLNGSAIQLINDIPSDLPCVEADEYRLQQIVYKLLNNAIKFTPSGSVTIKAMLKDSYVDIQVVDTGIGIPEDMQGEIFKPFQQVDGSSSRAFEGTGLGLAITKQLVELHGGTMRVDSKPGDGATFTFSLPVSEHETSLTAPALADS